jgi:L-ascorbate metabolism protein UlaG (beta-lactamase superfamily)
MTISWYGEACFLLESGGVKILIEPPQKESGINPPRFKSDVLIYSKPRNGKQALNDLETAAFVVDSPGEYETKGVNILGINDENNILYNIEMDGIKIAHLGFLNKDLNDEKMTFLDDPNVVLIPVGDKPVLDAGTAMKLINRLEPSVAIPMLYNIKGLKIKRAPLSAFIKESEAKDSPQPKLTVKKKDLTEEETKIVILEHA